MSSDFLDRALAATDAIASILVIIAAIMLWYRRLVPPVLTKWLPAAPELQVEPLATSLAIILGVLALRFAVNAGSLLGWWPQNIFWVDVIRMILSYFIIGSSVATLRTATNDLFGNLAVLVCICFALLGGCGLYFFG